MDQRSEASTHYETGYFNWQKNLGMFGGWANAFKFKESVRPDDTVIDFGCGGGFLLQRLNCRERIGIEPNPAAADSIRTLGIKHFVSSGEALGKVGRETVDVIISTNVLEHTLNPLQELINLLPLLKRGGIIHFIVPCDSFKKEWKPNDINHHLFSWSPMNLGNLFSEAGYKVDFAAPYVHKWPPYFRQISTLGWPVFNLACRIYGRLERSWFQVEIKAKKP